MKNVMVATLAFVLLLTGCATTSQSGGDTHWTRVGYHVVFQNLSADDHGRDFWAWDDKPVGQSFPSVTVRVTKKRGSLDHGYGIVWAFRDDGNYTRLLINANQQIAIHEYHDGQESILVDWQGLAALQVGLGTTNEIRLEQIESGIHLTVNGKDSGILQGSYPLVGKLGCFAAVGFNETQANEVVVEYDFDDPTPAQE